MTGSGFLWLFFCKSTLIDSENTTFMVKTQFYGHKNKNGLFRATFAKNVWILYIVNGLSSKSEKYLPEHKVISFSWWLWILNILKGLSSNSKKYFIGVSYNLIATVIAFSASKKQKFFQVCLNMYLCNFTDLVI